MRSRRLQIPNQVRSWFGTFLWLCLVFFTPCCLLHFSEDNGIQSDIILSNVQIYQTVFGFLGIFFLISSIPVPASRSCPSFLCRRAEDPVCVFQLVPSFPSELPHYGSS